MLDNSKKEKFTDEEKEILNQYHWGYIPLIDGKKNPKKDFTHFDYKFIYGVKNTSNKQILEAKKIKGKVNDLKTVEDCKAYLDIMVVEKNNSAGGFLRDGFCFVDIDKQEQIEKVEELIENKAQFFDNITVMRTGYHTKENTKRGFHIPFKIPKDFKYKPKTFNGLFAGGLVGELKLNGCEPLKLNGECRQLEQLGEIPELPVIFYPLENKIEISPVLNSSENKNNALTSMRGKMRKRGLLTEEQIITSLLFINNNIFAFPLEENELKTSVLRKDFYNSSLSVDFLKKRDRILLDNLEEGEEKYLNEVRTTESGVNLYDSLALFIVEKFHVIKIGESEKKSKLFYYNNNEGIYDVLSEEELTSYIAKIKPLTSKQIFEIVFKVRSFAQKYRLEDDNKNLHPYNNGYINTVEADTPEEVKNLKVHPFTPDIKFFFKIPHNWNPQSENENEGYYYNFVNKFIFDLACGNEEYITKLFEIGALCLWRSSGDGIEKKAFFLTGKGANGKSTFLEFLTFCFGDNNCSKVSPLDLSNRFRQGNLLNKLLNVDDDIGHQRFQAEVLKKVVTGNPLTCEKKFQDDFRFIPFCTCLFACNSIPTNDDFSSAMEGRLAILKFKANFSRTSNKSKRDINFKNKIQQEKMAEYYLFEAEKYQKKILLNGGKLEKSPLCEKNVSEYMSASSPLYGFLYEWKRDKEEDAKEKGKTYNPEKPLENILLDDIYNSYTEYCEKDGRVKIPRNRFSMEVTREEECETIRKRGEDEGGFKVRGTFFIYPD